MDLLLYLCVFLSFFFFFTAIKLITPAIIKDGYHPKSNGAHMSVLLLNMNGAWRAGSDLIMSPAPGDAWGVCVIGVWLELQVFLSTRHKLQSFSVVLVYWSSVCYSWGQHVELCLTLRSVHVTCQTDQWFTRYCELIMALTASAHYCSKIAPNSCFEDSNLQCH